MGVEGLESLHLLLQLLQAVVGLEAHNIPPDPHLPVVIFFPATGKIVPGGEGTTTGF